MAPRSQTSRWGQRQGRGGLGGAGSRWVLRPGRTVSGCPLRRNWLQLPDGAGCAWRRGTKCGKTPGVGRRDPCRDGFTTGSCRTATAPAGRAGWRGGGTVLAGAWAGRPASGTRGQSHPCPPMGDAAAETDFAPSRRPDLGARSSALHINPPGCSCRPAGRRRAGPAPRRRPRPAAWSWRCQPPGWRWRRGAGSCRRDLRSAGRRGL